MIINIPDSIVFVESCDSNIFGLLQKGLSAVMTMSLCAIKLKLPESGFCLYFLLISDRPNIVWIARFHDRF